MTGSAAALAGWPALEGALPALPLVLTYERGVWGKVHGSRSDFRWIATTPSFAPGQRRGELAGELNLGTEDAPLRSSHWRSAGDVHYAVSCYPSRATDASGRGSFLEKQVLEWRRPPGLPAALGALALLPLATTWDDSVWWGRQAATRWDGDDDSTLNLSPTEHAPALGMTAGEVDAAIARGVAALAATVGEPALAELYAALLAGGAGLQLHGLKEPLPPEAVAALLLPLRRALADTVSIAGWLPARRVPDAGELRANWQLVLGGDAVPPPPGSAPSPEHQREGAAMAASLLAGEPSRAVARAVTTRRAPVDAGRPVEIAMWGPSSAGKTALLAKLYIDADGDWQVYPTETSFKFIQDMRQHMATRNGFPPATVVGGNGDRIEYQFLHKHSGLEVSLRMQDRAGADSESLSPDIRAALASAAGLVLLFDPLSEGTALESQVWRTLEQVHVSSGRGTQRDPRPIAVCVSKADVLIESPQDLRRAREQPDAFVHQHDRMQLVRALDRFCERYRLFPVSAAGVLLRHGVIEPTVFYDEGLAPRIRPGGEVLNLMAPFTWLLDEVTRAS